jgi:hypothetical protein
MSEITVGILAARQGRTTRDGFACEDGFLELAVVKAIRRQEESALPNLERFG